jgi:hypothetical protein
MKPKIESLNKITCNFPNKKHLTLSDKFQKKEKKKKKKSTIEMNSALKILACIRPQPLRGLYENTPWKPLLTSRIRSMRLLKRLLQ